MQMIRPITDLRNHFSDISMAIHEDNQPVFFTKDGYGDMVLMSMQMYENLQFESEVYFKLQEAEKQAALSNKRYSSQEVLKELQDIVAVK